jgi:hypothetical protein
MSKKNKNATKADTLTSIKQATWEDGVKDTILAILKGRRREDGSETPEASAANAVENIMLRVGALTSKTKSGAAELGANGKVSEPFEILPVKLHDGESGSEDTTYVTVNWRVGIVDMINMALAAIVTSLAFGQVRASATTPEELKKAKRFGSKEFKGMLASLGMTREPIKVDGKNDGYAWTFGGPSEQIIKDVHEAIGDFPAEALAFFKDKETVNRSASIFLDFGGEISKLQYNGKVVDAVALVNHFQNAGITVARLQYEHEKLATEASKLLPSLVYLGKGEVLFVDLPVIIQGEAGPVEVNENKDEAAA